MDYTGRPVAHVQIEQQNVGVKSLETALSEISIISASILWLEHVDVTEPHNQALLSKSCRYRQGESADSQLVHIEIVILHTCSFPAKILHYKEDNGNGRKTYVYKLKYK